jgi:hypothetical protein
VSLMLGPLVPLPLSGGLCLVSPGGATSKEGCWPGLNREWLVCIPSRVICPCVSCFSLSPQI